MTAGLVLALAAAVAVQDQTPVPAFKAGVELVRLDVRVTDALGRPVRDLRSDEIEIVEDGDRRPVVFFQHIGEPAESYAEVARHTIAGEVSTNQGAARGHLYVLVFDQLHIAPGREQRVRQAARRFVQTRLRPGDRVALYALPGPGPQIPFTADARRIAAELSNARGMAEPQAFGALGSMTLQEAYQIARGNDQVFQRVAERIQVQSGASDAGRRLDTSLVGASDTPLTNPIKEDAERIVNITDGQTRRVLAALTDVLRAMRGIEGRKSVLFISEGFYADHLSREIEQVAAAAAESYSVVQTFDLNRREPDITLDAPAGADQANAIHDTLSPLGTLAAETGGMLVVDAGLRAEEAFTTIADQSQDYYLVGFTPRSEALKDRGAYRRVNVRVRRGGTQVSTRTGFALNDGSARLDRRQTIDRALASPFPLQGLPVQYTTYVLRGSASGLQRVILSLAAELPLVSRERPAAADHPNVSDVADIAFVVRAAADGHVAASGRDTIALPERRMPAGTNGTGGTGTFRAQFELPPGDYLMRAIVREPGGLVGSADRRFAVRALNGPALESGDLVLSATRGELPVRPAAYIGDGLSGVLELYARTADQLRDARVLVDLIPVGEDAAIVSGSADLQPIRAIAGGAAREARVALPLPSVAPGTYVARARVLSGPDTVSQVVREIEIRQGQRPLPIAGDEADPPAAFDPRAVVTGVVAREYAAASTTGADGRRGLERLGAGDFPAAIAAFQAALNADVNNGAAAFLLGWAFHGAGDDRQAISAWRRAAFVDPTLVSAHLALADAYVRLAQPALAVQALRAGLVALPHSVELLDRLSRIEQR
ncbi:MAG: VWA domain-containing protein [Acidobacteria bacterium]|nr:VWA domain-containing protein [Acidobacteriota bacterium]